MFQGGLERGRVRGSMSRIPGAVTTNATNGAAHDNRSLFLTLLEVRCSARESIPRLSPSFWGQLVTCSAPQLVPVALPSSSRGVLSESVFTRGPCVRVQISSFS